MTCSACERVERIRLGTNPSFIAELRETYAVLHDHQPYRGWVVLLLKDHHEHFGQLLPDRQANIARDLGDAAAAIRSVTNCPRINYECLGNVLAHVHWHVIPRYLSPIDPDPKKAVWIQPESFLNAPLEPSARDELVENLRAAWPD